MNLEKLTALVISILEDNKATNIQTLDVRSMTSVTDLMIIASGTSNRQVMALAEKIIEGTKKEGIQPTGTEGKQHGEWALVDLGDIIVHIMHPSIRAHYQLEKLWMPLEEAEATEQTLH